MIASPRALILVSILLIPTSQAAVFFDDFNTGSVTNSANGFLGGFYGGQLGFNQWYGGTTDASIGGGSLTVGSSFNYRSGVMILPPSTFTDGAGDYIATIGVSGYQGDSNDQGLVRIWSGQGYDLTNSSADGIFVDTQTGTFALRGNATVEDLASAAFTSTGSVEVEFTYDGVSAIGIFLGAETSGWPFPEVEYSQISIDSATSPGAIPEPSSAVLGMLGFLALLARRARS